MHLLVHLGRILFISAYELFASVDGVKLFLDLLADVGNGVFGGFSIGIVDALAVKIEGGRAGDFVFVSDTVIEGDFLGNGGTSHVVAELLVVALAVGDGIEVVDKEVSAIADAGILPIGLVGKQVISIELVVALQGGSLGSGAGSFTVFVVGHIVIAEDHDYVATKILEHLADVGVECAAIGALVVGIFVDDHLSGVNVATLDVVGNAAVVFASLDVVLSVITAVVGGALISKKNTQAFCKYNSKE